MSLLDHSFHDFDIDLWVNNFAELTEPEYVLQSMDDLIMSQDSEELLALLKKDAKESTYDKIMHALSAQDQPQLFCWCVYPADFIKDTGITFDDDRYIRFLSEFIPGFVLYKNKWDRNQFGIELRKFIDAQKLMQPYLRKNTRLKLCGTCGYNLSDIFTMNLVTDNILDGTPVTCVCPHCNCVNYIKY